jgi:hypothetical protein
MTLSNDALAERLEQRLMSHGIYVTNYTYHDGALHIGYETTTPGDGVPKNEIGRLLNVLLDAREDGWEPTDVHAWVYDIGDDEDEDAEPRGHWEAREGWMHALEAGHISETDFSTLVLSTVRT